MPFYQPIIRRLVQLEVGSATVQAGIMGYGTHHKIHRKRLCGKVGRPPGNDQRRGQECEAEVKSADPVDGAERAKCCSLRST